MYIDNDRETSIFIDSHRNLFARLTLYHFRLRVIQSTVCKCVNHEVTEKDASQTRDRCDS